MVTKEQLAEAILELKNSSIDLKASQEKSDKKMIETQESLKRLGKMVGGISNNQGDIAEEFFWNSISHNPTLNGIKYDYADKNRHKKINGIEDEYDILLVNGNDIAIIETKYKAHLNDIERLITRKYSNFKKLYPEYKDYNHHLGLASFNINEDVKEKALQNNVILLQRKGDIIETIVPS